MVLFNKGENAASVNTVRFHEMLDGMTSAKDVMTDKSFDLGQNIDVPARSVMILEIK
jgi:hypothetical protein